MSTPLSAALTASDTSVLPAVGETYNFFTGTETIPATYMADLKSGYHKVAGPTGTEYIAQRNTPLDSKPGFITTNHRPALVGEKYPVFDVQGSQGENPRCEYLGPVDGAENEHELIMTLITSRTLIANRDSMLTAPPLFKFKRWKEE